MLMRKKDQSEFDWSKIHFHSTGMTDPISIQLTFMLSIAKT